MTLSVVCLHNGRIYILTCLMYAAAFYSQIKSLEAMARLVDARRALKSQKREMMYQLRSLRVMQNESKSECGICLQQLHYEILTQDHEDFIIVLDCGHDFCRSCLHQSMRHSNRCPTCRQVVEDQITAPVPNVAIEIRPPALAGYDMDHIVLAPAPAQEGQDGAEHGHQQEAAVHMTFPWDAKCFFVFKTITKAIQE